MPKGRPRRRRARQKNRASLQTRAILEIVLTRQFAGFILVLLAVLVLFSLLGSVEPYSTWWKALFGWFFPLAVLAILVGGFMVALSSPGRWQLRSFWQPLTGLALAFLALMAILSLLFTPPRGSGGGGLLGTWVALPLRGLGSAGSFLALLLMGTVATLWGCKVPPRAVFQRLDTAGKGLRALSRQGTKLSRRERPAGALPEPAPPPRPVQMERKPLISQDVEAEVEPEALAPIIKGETAPAAAKALPETPAPLRRTESGTLEWQLPPIDLMDSTAALEPNEREIRKKAQIIEEALASFGVPVKVTEISQGPAVTQFGIEPGFDIKTKEIRDREKRIVRVDEVSRTKVKVSRITSLSNDLALALSAQSLRIQAPVPGRSVVGIEVPNTSISLVGLRGVIESVPFQRNIAKSKLALALGRGVDGEAIVGDLAKMPHLLIAGATGSGKSVCLNSLIACLLMHTTPDDVRLLLVDPKRVEMAPFRGIPHLWTPVVMEVDEVVRVLKMVTHEMDERYKKFAHASARNIDAYNKRPLDKPLPYLVVIIDELADLMMVAPDDVERTICRLAQLARATGIHLVVATQRPSVDVVTGLIKANFPTRISFAVTSQVDSRTILDQGGAEKLLGRGDMLFMSSDSSRPVRLQGSYVSDAELERMVTFWKGIKDPQYVWERNQIASWSEEPAASDDPLLEAARKMAQENVRLSPSLLQRRLHVGYPRAARLLEILEEEGLAPTGGQSRSDGDVEDGQPPF